jgi:hypothetical protein
MKEKIRLWRYFRDTEFAQHVQGKVDNLDFIKIKIFCASKNTFKKVKPGASGSNL